MGSVKGVVFLRKLAATALVLTSKTNSSICTILVN